MTKHPAKCPICLAFWDFRTDSLGQLVAIHPVTKCIPVKGSVAYERAAVRCVICQGLFVPTCKNKRICESEVCRLARKVRYRMNHSHRLDRSRKSAA